MTKVAIILAALALGQASEINATKLDRMRNPAGRRADRVYLEIPCASLTDALVEISVETSRSTVVSTDGGTTCVLKFYTQQFSGRVDPLLTPHTARARRTKDQQLARMPAAP